MGKESERSKRIRRGAGNALLATSVAVPAFFVARGKLRIDRLKRLIKKSVVPLDDLEQRTVQMAKANGKTVGKDLPGFYLEEYPWLRRRVPRRPISHGLTAEPGSEAERLIMKDRKEYDELLRKAVDIIDGKEYEKIPVYTNKKILVNYKTEGMTGLKRWKAKKALDGPFYGHEGLFSDMSNPSYKPYISTGGYSSPNVLLHELGHAQAHRFHLGPEGPSSVKGMIKDVFAGLIHPGKTRKVRNETLAWDLAGVPKNDKIRRAALSTYTNNARATPAILLSSQLMPVGAGLRINTKEDSPKSGRKPRRSKMKKSSAYIAGFMSKCAECGVEVETAIKLLEKRGAFPIGKALAGMAGLTGITGLASHLANRKDPNRSMESYRSTGRKWGTALGAFDAIPGALAGGFIGGPLGALAGAAIGGGAGALLGRGLGHLGGSAAAGLAGVDHGRSSLGRHPASPLVMRAAGGIVGR